MAFRIWGGMVHVLSTHNGEAVAVSRTWSAPSGTGTARAACTACRSPTPSRTGSRAGAWRLPGRPGRPRPRRRGSRRFDRSTAPTRPRSSTAPRPPARGAWLSWEQIRKVEHAEAGDPKHYAKGRTIIGNDIARRRHLWVAWVLELVGDVAWTREVVELQNESFAAQDDTLDKLVKRYRPTCIAMDQTGMGEKPVEDAQRRYGAQRVEGVLMTPANRLEIAGALKRRVEDVNIRVPKSTAIRQDLHAVRRAAGPHRGAAPGGHRGQRRRARRPLLGGRAGLRGGRDEPGRLRAAPGQQPRRLAGPAEPWPAGGPCGGGGMSGAL